MRSRSQVFKIPPIIVCEGRSEREYLTLLNKLLVRGTFSAFCKAISADSGVFSIVKKTVIQQKKNNKKADVFAWVDKDIYCRTRKYMDAYQKRGTGIPNFWFSIMNFEDFLALHYDESTLKDYESKLKQMGHFSQPLESDKHLPIFRETCCQNYEKGYVPFELTQSRLAVMFNNLGKSNISCDFAFWLKEQISSHEVRFRDS